MTAASWPRAIKLRSGDVVQVRPVRPADAPALARAYASLGEQSRYQRFFTAMPELPEGTLQAATDVDHENHEALIAVPLLSGEIVGECRFVRRAARWAMQVIDRLLDQRPPSALAPPPDPATAAPGGLGPGPPAQQAILAASIVLALFADEPE